MSYCGYVTRIKEVRPHTNADKLQIATVFMNDVVVGLNMNKGDLVLYFPTDGKLGEEYAKENNLLRKKDENGNNIGGFLDADKRNIRAIRLRGERSDGLIMPLSSLSKFTDISTLKEGDTITTLGGAIICEKYIPRGKRVVNQQQGKKKKNKINQYPFFEEHVDTSQFAYNTDKFREGDICYITLKLHGTSQRSSYAIKRDNSLLSKMLNKIGIKLKNKYELISGTRRVVLENYDGGFYGGNEFRKKWHDFFDGKLQKGESVYYEVVGWVNDDTTIMPRQSNGKMNDKEFVKKYGEETVFSYGCDKGENDIYVYRMTMTNEDGHVIEYPTELVQLRCEQMGVKFAPILDKFIYSTHEDLMKRVQKHEDGEDPIGKTHVREGIIVRIDNRDKFTAYKQKNFSFKILEGIIKDEEVLDMEEAENL